MTASWPVPEGARRAAIDAVPAVMPTDATLPDGTVVDPGWPAEVAVDAAAPHIVAATLRQAAERIRGDEDGDWATLCRRPRPVGRRGTAMIVPGVPEGAVLAAHPYFVKCWRASLCPHGYEDDCVREALAAAAPYIAALTLRQAASRYTTEIAAAVHAATKALRKDATLGQEWDGAVRVQAAEGVAAVLNRWAEQVQP